MCTKMHLPFSEALSLANGLADVVSGGVILGVGKSVFIEEITNIDSKYKFSNRSYIRM